MGELILTATHSSEGALLNPSNNCTELFWCWRWLSRSWFWQSLSRSIGSILSYLSPIPQFVLRPRQFSRPHLLLKSTFTSLRQQTNFGSSVVSCVQRCWASHSERSVTVSINPLSSIILATCLQNEIRTIHSKLDPSNNRLGVQGYCLDRRPQSPFRSHHSIGKPGFKMCYLSYRSNVILVLYQFNDHCTALEQSNTTYCKTVSVSKKSATCLLHKLFLLQCRRLVTQT